MLTHFMVLQVHIRSRIWFTKHQTKLTGANQMKFKLKRLCCWTSIDRSIYSYHISNTALEQQASACTWHFLSFSTSRSFSSLHCDANPILSQTPPARSCVPTHWIHIRPNHGSNHLLNHIFIFLVSKSYCNSNSCVYKSIKMLTMKRNRKSKKDLWYNMQSRGQAGSVWDRIRTTSDQGGERCEAVEACGGGGRTDT